MEGAGPILSVRGLWKIYPNGVEANKEINLDIHPGRVYALLGENGAGKTTLVKILSGVEKPTRGTITLWTGGPGPSSPAEAQRLGIYMVPQHPTLFPNLTVLEDVGLSLALAGHKLSRGRVEELIREASTRYGLHVNPHARINGLSVGERQRVEILKGVLIGRRLLFLDEPSTHLAPGEVEALIGLTRRLAGEGRSVVYITHRIEEALRAADAILVMRRGRLEAVMETREATREKVLRAMFGTIPPSPRPRQGRPRGEVLRVEDLWVRSRHGGWALRGVTLVLRRGEVLGVAGIAGNGQRELLEAIAGLTKPARGRILLDGRPLDGLPPRRRLSLGLSVVPEERLGWSVAPGLSVWANIVLPLKARNGGGLLLRRRETLEAARRVVSSTGVRAPSLGSPVETLSGGNIQRLVLGRELASRPRVVVAMNPVAGLDYGASSMILGLLAEEAARGAGVLLIDEDLDTLASVSDRIVVLSRGVLTGEYARPFSLDQIASAMTMR